jgi:hypothetical protein
MRFNFVSDRMKQIVEESKNSERNFSLSTYLSLVPEFAKMTNYKSRHKKLMRWKHSIARDTSLNYCSLSVNQRVCRSLADTIKCRIETDEKFSNLFSLNLLRSMLMQEWCLVGKPEQFHKHKYGTAWAYKFVRTHQLPKLIKSLKLESQQLNISIAVENYADADLNGAEYSQFNDNDDNADVFDDNNEDDNGCVSTDYHNTDSRTWNYLNNSISNKCSNIVKTVDKRITSLFNPIVSQFSSNPTSQYCDRQDVQNSVPHSEFLSLYQTSINSYNTYAGNGKFGTRVVVHVHHFPSVSGCEAVSQPLFDPNDNQFPKWDRLLQSRFDYLIQYTGLNMALLIVTHGPFNLLEAISSSLYATQKDRILSDKRIPRDSYSLLQVCKRWLMKPDNLKKSVNILVKDDELHSCNKSDSFLDLLCVLFAANTTSRLDKVVYEGGDSDRKSKKCLDKLATIDWDRPSTYEMLFPAFNSILIRVLCELYHLTVDVIDLWERVTLSYLCKKQRQSPYSLILFKIEEKGLYYGAVDCNCYMK